MVLQQKRQLLLEARSSKGKPFVVEYSTKDLMDFFMEHHLDAGARSILCQYSFETSPYEPCLKPLNMLRKMEICQLRLSTRHRGSFLLLRIISSVDETRTLLAVAEDEDERAILVQIFNPPETMRNRQIEIFSPIIIKEPLVELVAWGEMGIRVDHPSDLVCPSRYDRNLPLEWKRGKPGRNNINCHCFRLLLGDEEVSICLYFSHQVFVFRKWCHISFFFLISTQWQYESYQVSDLSSRWRLCNCKATQRWGLSWWRPTIHLTWICNAIAWSFPISTNRILREFILIGQVSLPGEFGGARSCFAEPGALRTTSTRTLHARPHSQVISMPVRKGKCRGQRKGTILLHIILAWHTKADSSFIVKDFRSQRVKGLESLI